MVQVNAVVRAGAIGAFALAVLIFARWCSEHRRGVEVRIHNAGSHTLSSVAVVVTGNSYSLGDLPPNSTRSVVVVPTGESDVGISLVDPAGHVKRLNAGGYFEPGYTGTISVDLTAEAARTIDDNVNPD